MTIPEQIILPSAGQPIEQPLQLGVSVHSRRAVLHFSEPREYVALEPNLALAIGTKIMLSAMEADNTIGQQVIEMALQLVDLVYELRGELKPAGGAVKHELIERHRHTLTRRLEVILNTRRERKRTSNAQLSKELVDVVLHEIFS